MNADFVTEMDIKQSGPAARRCPVNPEHGRLTVGAGGLMLMCCNRVSQQDYKQGDPVVKLEGSKVVVCGYSEPVGS